MRQLRNDTNRNWSRLPRHPGKGLGRVPSGRTYSGNIKRRHSHAADETSGWWQSATSSSDSAQSRRTNPESASLSAVSRSCRDYAFGFFTNNPNDYTSGCDSRKSIRRDSASRLRAALLQLKFACHFIHLRKRQTSLAKRGAEQGHLHRRRGSDFPTCH